MSDSKNVIESFTGSITVGSMFRGYRISHEISLDRMSQKIKVSEKELMDIEAGTEQLPLKEVLKIAEQLDEPQHIYARVWCEEQVKRAGLDFDDIVKVI